MTYHPDFAPEDDHAVMDAVRHYALDRSCCWSVHRAAFAWQTARPPALRTLALCMTQQPVRVPGPHFRAAADAAVPFPAPDGTAYPTLHIKSFTQGLYDLRAFRLLESLSSKEHAVKFIEDFANCNVTFSDYPRQDDFCEKLRFAVNKKIADLISK